jgi:hypothetical protein
MNKQTDEIEIFDFGFSFADENYEEISEKQQEQHQNTTEKIEDLQKRLNLLYQSIIPFLDNLCKNPEKSTILWPNRVEKIESFKQKLKQIVEGNNR